jgi:hypothetical protein
MAMIEFGVIRAQCDNCGRLHDEHVLFPKKYTWKKKSEKEYKDDVAKAEAKGELVNSVMRETYKRTPHEFRWSEVNARDKRKDMKRYLKECGWQVGEEKIVCDVCLNEIELQLVAEYESNN